MTVNDLTRHKVIGVAFLVLFIIAAILPFLLVRYVPSLDGPQHLYNARLTAELIKGNEFIAQFFRFNPVLIGNLSAIYIMAVLMLIFPAFIAEKILLVCYVIGLVIAFRYFLRSMTKSVPVTCLLILPLGFNSLFMLGYYNFCLAFIPFFFALGFLRRHERRIGLKEFVWLAILGLVIYLTHAIVFVFYGAVIMLLALHDAFLKALRKNETGTSWLSLVKRYSLVLISSIPAIALWLQYYLLIETTKIGVQLVEYKPVTSILKDLYNLTILVGFHLERETGPNTILLGAMAILFLAAVLPGWKLLPDAMQEPEHVISRNDRTRWTFVLLVIFILLLTMPDRFVTGSMSVRLSILLLFVFSAWLALRRIPAIISVVAMVLVLISFSWHRIIVLDYYKSLDKDIAVIKKAEENMAPGTIMYPVNCTDNWVQGHFLCYIGVDKPVVNILNPQGTGAMPLVWNHDKMPDFLVGAFAQSALDTLWAYGNPQLDPMPADYVFVWRPLLIGTRKGIPELLDKIDPYYDEIYRSGNMHVLLLGLNREE